jgi:DNA-binding NarL/FixJ family response regulator
MDIVIVDAYTITHFGIKYILSQNKTGFEVKRSYTNGKDFLNDNAGNNTDLIILGLFVTGIDTFDLITYLTASGVKARIAVYAYIFNQEVILKSIKAGANGIISQTVSENNFVRGLKGIMYNTNFTCVGNESKFKFFIKNNSLVKDYTLTKREHEILQLITEGIKNIEIAAILNISLSTVEFHRKNIYLKLNVKNVAELVSKIHRTNSKLLSVH